MHVLILALGSAGDVNPFILIGSALKEDGHQVDLITNPYFERKVRHAGLNFVAVSSIEEFRRILENEDIWTVEKAFSAIWQSTVDHLPETYELVLKHAAAGTLLIASTLGIAARLAQEKHGFDLVSVHLAPSIMLSGYDVPRSITSPLPASFSPWLKGGWMKLIEAIFLDPICKPGLNAFRLQIGLPAVKHVFGRWIHSPQMVLCAFPDWFAAVQKDWPPNSFNAPFLLFKEEHDSPLSEQLLDFLDSGAPPLVLTAGTAMAFARPIFETGLAAASRLAMRAVVVSELEHKWIAPAQDSLVVPYANFESLFKRAAVVSHHGGIGTTAMALNCGVPQLIVPHAHDQFDNGARVEKLGAGKMLSGAGLTANHILSGDSFVTGRNRDQIESWTATIASLRSDKTYQVCQSLAAKMPEDKPAKQVIDLLYRQGLLKRC